MWEQVYQTMHNLSLILSNKKYLIWFLALAVSIFSFLYWLQVLTVPGNSVTFQAALYGVKDWLLLALISILNSLFVVVQMHTADLKRKNKLKHSYAGGFAVGGAGMLSTVTASIFGTATCGLCAAAIFSFLGANSVIFLVQHKNLITLIAIGLLVVALVISLKRFNTMCKQCKI